MIYHPNLQTCTGKVPCVFKYRSFKDAFLSGSFIPLQIHWTVHPSMLLYRKSFNLISILSASSDSG